MASMMLSASARPTGVTLKASKPAQLGSITSSFRGLSLAKPVAHTAGCQCAGCGKGGAMVVEAKLKTKKAAAKRFKVTGGGKVMCRHAMKGHLLAKKKTSRKKRLSKENAVSVSDYNNVIGMMPFAGIKKP